MLHFAVVSLPVLLVNYHRKTEARERSRKYYKIKEGNKDGRIVKRK
jgi:hypothetical protein